MKIPSYINIQDFNYTLPEEKIARYPLESRDSSKLLYFKDGIIENRQFTELPDLLTEQYHLIFNDTKVIQARLLFKKQTGAIIEIFLLEPFLPSEYQLAFGSNHECVWKCLIGNAKKCKNEVLQLEISIGDQSTTLNAEHFKTEGTYFLIRFFWNNDKLCLSDIIESAGSTPIPPYLNRKAEDSDSIRYQTVYSVNEGSVAAPTAGLHFTDDIMELLENKSISQTKLTLHVGAGTFVPVKAENARDHVMHAEHIYINRKSIESLFKSEKKFIAVGTTSVRTLESLYHIAVRIKNGIDIRNELSLEQWDAYNTASSLSRKECFESILFYMDELKTDTFKMSTRIMITPEYKFRMVDGIITNFHQPASTLLLLISAYIGDDWKKVYNHALQNNYRFLSYGDSSLLMITKK